MLSITCFILLTSCSNKTPAEVLEESIVGELNAFQRLDGNILNDFSNSMDIVELEQFDVDTEKFLREMFNGFSFNVDTIYIGEDEAHVYISFISKDYIEFENILKTKVDEMVESDTLRVADDETFKERFGNAIMESMEMTPFKRYQNIDVAYEKNGNTWTSIADISFVLADTMINA